MFYNIIESISRDGPDTPILVFAGFTSYISYTSYTSQVYMYMHIRAKIALLTLSPELCLHPIGSRSYTPFVHAVGGYVVCVGRKHVSYVVGVTG